MDCNLCDSRTRAQQCSHPPKLLPAPSHKGSADEAINQVSGHRNHRLYVAQLVLSHSDRGCHRSKLFIGQVRHAEGSHYEV